MYQWSNFQIIDIELTLVYTLDQTFFLVDISPSLCMEWDFPLEISKSSKQIMTTAKVNKTHLIT